jgi:hypothetical protein
MVTFQRLEPDPILGPIKDSNIGKHTLSYLFEFYFCSPTLSGSKG